MTSHIGCKPNEISQKQNKKQKPSKLRAKCLTLSKTKGVPPCQPNKTDPI